MTKTLYAALAASAAFALPVGAQAQRAPATVTVVVDSSRVLNECTACRAAQAQLKTQADSLRARATALQTQLQTEGQPIQTAVNGLAGRQPDAALQARIAAFQKKQQDAATEIQGREQTFGRNRAYVGQQLNQRMAPIVTSVMKARGANVAVDAQQVFGYEPALDITNDVLAQVNQQVASVSVTAPAAAAAPATTPAPTGR